jgi:hypothetical protein
VFEQGDPSGKAIVVDLSSSLDKKNLIPDTSRDIEFAQCLYGELNCALLGLPGDAKIIIHNDSNEEEEAHEETVVDAKAAPSTAAVKP